MAESLEKRFQELVATMPLDLGLITGSLSPMAGGVFQSMRIPANILAQRGAKVSVYGLLDGQFEQARSRWQVSTLQAFPVLGLQRLGFSPAMMRVVRNANHDLLHLQGLWFYPSHVANEWRRHKMRPTIISPRGMLDEWSLRKSSFKKRLVRLLYEDSNLHHASVLHALNIEEARSFRKFGLVNPIAIIPNGVDLPELQRTPPRPLGFDRDCRKTLLFLGRIHPKKGVKELVQAWDLVRRLKPGICDEWRIAIAGWDDGGHQAEIEALVETLRLNEHVTFLGPLYDETKTAVLRNSRAFILPSYSEGMPMAVLEAWSFELPVFMTPACNLTEGFEANAAFEISSTPEKMGRTLVETLGEDTLLTLAGQEGRRLVAQRYTWESSVDKMLSMYSWLLEMGPRPDFVQ